MKVPVSQVGRPRQGQHDAGRCCDCGPPQPVVLTLRAPPRGPAERTPSGTSANGPPAASGDQHHHAEERQIHPVVEGHVGDGHHAAGWSEQDEKRKARKRPHPAAECRDRRCDERDEHHGQRARRSSDAVDQGPVIVEAQADRPDGQPKVMQNHLRLGKKIEQRRVNGLTELRVGPSATTQDDDKDNQSGGDPCQKRQPRPWIPLSREDPPVQHDKRGQDDRSLLGEHRGRRQGDGRRLPTQPRG